jgi:hypothetical protein|tara:strand:+ start:181 stop:432 length:252 start_codon:yes stop_codon:yes gene_type:complete
MFKKNATDEERVEAAEKYFDELLRNCYSGLVSEHKNVNGKNTVEVYVMYPAENVGENPSSLELITFKGNSDEFESVETIREIG